MSRTMSELRDYLAELSHDDLMREHELFTTLSDQGYMKYGSMQAKQYQNAEMVFKKALKEAGEDI